MIRSLPVLALLALVGCAATPASEVDSQSNEIKTERPTVSSDKQLSNVLNGLSDAAAFGASLEFFGWSEEPKVSTSSCHDGTAADAVKEFNDVIDTVYQAGDLAEAPWINDEVIADAKARFKVLAGEGSYLICSSSGGGFMTWNKVTALIGGPTGVKLSLETGWED